MNELPPPNFEIVDYIINGKKVDPPNISLVPMLLKIGADASMPATTQASAQTTLLQPMQQHTRPWLSPTQNYTTCNSVASTKLLKWL